MNYTNQNTKRSSNGDSANNKSTQQVQEGKYTGKPLIVPANRAKESAIGKSDQSSTTSDFDWLNIFSRTFLSIYLNPKDANLGSGKYDFVFDINGHRIYLLVQHEDMMVDRLTVSESMLYKFKQRAATKLTKRFQQVRNRVNLPKLTQDDTVDESGIHSIHCLGLTALTVLHEGKSYPLAHEYGSRFFQEDCVLDLDGEDAVMQLFSLGGFLDMLKLLQTPSDVLSFLDYHLPILVEMEDYENESALAKQYVADPAFFKRALKIERKLVEIGLLGEVEARLLEVSEGKITKSAFSSRQRVNQNKEFQAHKTELLDKLQSYSRMYQKLINGVTKRRHNAEDVIPIKEVQLLVDESMYTRMSIMEEVVAYANRSTEDHRQGYLSHQHSYNSFGRHYVLVIYGSDQNAEYSKDNVSRDYSELLTDINSQLQSPVMSDYFVLGFDMSKQNKDGDLIVEMDVFHQPGTYMSDTERRLYQQVQELNGFTE